MATATVTLPANKYALLKGRAFLYEEIMRKLPEIRWGIEEYSDARIKEFMRADRLDRKMRMRMEKLLAR